MVVCWGYAYLLQSVNFKDKPWAEIVLSLLLGPHGYGRVSEHARLPNHDWSQEDSG